MSTTKDPNNPRPADYGAVMSSIGTKLSALHDSTEAEVLGVLNGTLATINPAKQKALAAMAACPTTSLRAYNDCIAKCSDSLDLFHSKLDTATSRAMSGLERNAWACMEAFDKKGADAKAEDLERCVTNVYRDFNSTNLPKFKLEVDAIVKDFHHSNKK
jgi:hypothetical protein